MPTKIESLWADLEADTTAPSGLLYRRYSASVKPDVFAGVRRISGVIQRLLVISLPGPVVLDLFTLHDLTLSVENDSARPSQQLILLTLINQAQTDLFGVVCEDLINQIACEIQAPVILKALANRLEQWVALFEGLSTEGLSREKRQGLYGELWFLHRWLNTGADLNRSLNAWTGPEGSIHDFQLSDQAVEIKTSSSVNPQTIQISNERQLDNTGLFNLWLWLIILDVRPTGGQSLNELIDTILLRFSASPKLQNQFRLKLYQAGYQPQHKSLYDAPTYHVLNDKVFEVGEDFPRIHLSLLPSGVSSVSYTVSLASCQPFSADSEQTLQKL